MPDDDLSVETTEAPIHPGEAALDRQLAQSLAEWGGNARQAEHAEPEPEEASAPEAKPSRKPSRAIRELDASPDFSGEDEAEDIEEQPEPKVPRDVKPAKAGKEGNDADADRKAKDDELQRELDELDRLDPQSMKPAQRANWKALKSVAKASKAEAKQRAAELEALREEYQTYRQAQEDPKATSTEIQAQLEQARQEAEALRKEAEALQQYRERYNFTTSEAYQELNKPVEDQFRGIIHELVQMQGGGKDMEAWAEQVLQMGPDAFDVNWWQQSVLDKIAADKTVNRQRATLQISHLLDLQQKRNKTVDSWERSPKIAQQYFQERQQQHWTAVHQGIAEAEPELIREYEHWPELKDAATTEAFKKEIMPALEKYLPMALPSDDVDAKTRGKNAAKIAAKCALYEVKNTRLERELAQTKLDLKHAESQARRLSAVRSVPAKAGGVSGRSKPQPAVDIFNDKPDFGWDSDD